MKLGPLSLFEPSPATFAAAGGSAGAGMSRGALTDELGRSGLVVLGGRIYDEFLPALQGYRAAKVYREMWGNDPVVSAIWFAVDMLIRKVTWTVEPASDSPQDAEAADFLDGCMQDMSSTWQDIVSEVLSMLIFGYAPLEIVYKWRRGGSADPAVPSSRFSDGRLGWRKLALRRQETVYEWQFDDTGGVQALVQVAPPDYQRRVIPIERLLLFRTLVYAGSPQGRSILRSAWRPWYFKKRIEEIEAIGIERDLAGLPVLKVPAQLLLPSASAAEKSLLAELKKLVTNIRRDAQEGVILPQQYDADGHALYDLELLSTGSRRQFDTGAVVTRKNQEMAMSVMADFLVLGHENVGSNALSMSKTDLFTAAIQAWADGIAAVVNRHGVTRLFALNRMQVERLPAVKPGRVDVPDLTELGAYIESLAKAGVLFPDGGLGDYLRGVAGLPERPEDEADEPVPAPEPTKPPQPEQDPAEPDDATEQEDAA